MVENDLSNIVGGPEKMGFKLTFEWTEWIWVSDGQREGIPEGRGGDGEGSVPVPAVLGLGDGVEKVGIGGA